MATESPVLPRVEITYCTQCKWLLRAAYFAQELLSTFSTSIGEVALIPATGGIFTVYIAYQTEQASAVHGEANVNANENGANLSEVKTSRLWDRKLDGGFPETKVLKQRVRDCIDPGRGLGHSDTPGKSKPALKTESVRPSDNASEAKDDGGEKCTDCQ